MNWKDLYTEATPVEREDIVSLLADRIQMRSPKPWNVRTLKENIQRLTVSRVRQFVSRLFVRPRWRAHWITGRRRRPERLFTVLLFLVAMLLLEEREYAIWATIAGGFTALLFPVLFFHYQLVALLAEVE